MPEAEVLEFTSTWNFWIYHFYGKVELNWIDPSRAALRGAEYGVQWLTLYASLSGMISTMVAKFEVEFLFEQVSWHFHRIQHYTAELAAILRVLPDSESATKDIRQTSYNPNRLLTSDLDNPVTKILKRTVLSLTYLAHSRAAVSLGHSSHTAVGSIT